MNDISPGSGASGSRRRGSGAKVRRLLPLTVWLCSDDSTTADPDGRSVDGAGTEHRSVHRRTVGRRLAHHLISTCTEPGDLVAEAYTTDEETLAVAARLGRRAVACLPEYSAALRPCRPDRMARGPADQLGRVGLVIAGPPFYPRDERVRSEETRRCPVCRTGFWMASEDRFRAFMAAAWRVLRPGGHLAVVTTARHEGGRLIDPASWIVRHAADLRFRYLQHVIAVRVPVAGDTLVVQTDPCGLAELRDVRSRALPPVARVHADVCLFTKPADSPGRDGDR